MKYFLMLGLIRCKIYFELIHKNLYSGCNPDTNSDSNTFNYIQGSIDNIPLDDASVDKYCHIHLNILERSRYKIYRIITIIKIDGKQLLPYFYH